MPVQRTDSGVAQGPEFNVRNAAEITWLPEASFPNDRQPFHSRPPCVHDDVHRALAALLLLSFAIQIAKARGARVIATASTANQDPLKQLCADVRSITARPISRMSSKTSTRSSIRWARKRSHVHMAW
jgi:hypothetical protein